MNQTPEKELRRTIRDVVALAAMPAAWLGRTPQQITDGVVDLLHSMLRVEVAYVRLKWPGEPHPIKASRTPNWPDFAAWYERRETGGSSVIRHGTPFSVLRETGTLRLVTVPVGIESDDGIIVAGAHRADFPVENDRLLLSVAANQAAIAFRAAKLVADRDQSLKELAKKEFELRDFVDNACIGLHWVGPDGTILWANKAELDMLGYTAEEYIGRNITDFHVDEPTIYDILQRLKCGELLHGYPSRLRCKDGSIREVTIHSSVYREAGEFIHTRCFTADVTERRIAERALAESEARMRRAHEAAKLGAFSWDLRSGKIHWSVTVPALSGLGEAATFDDWMNLIHSDDQHLVAEALEAAMSTGEFFGEWRISRSEFDDVWLLVRGELARDEQGAPAHIFGIAMDITDRKQAEVTLRRTEKLAATGRLAATIAHEINNPMQALSNLIALISYQTAGDTQTSQLVSLADSELRRISHITRQFLSFYRDTSKPISIDVKEVIEDVLHLFALKIREKRVKIDCRYDDHRLILGFPGELRQVFANLVGNALDVLPEHGRIRIHVDYRRDWKNPARQGLRVVIADNGAGMDKSVQHRIFEPFFTTKAERGTGLGLWVVHGIVGKHDGRITFRSSTRLGHSGTAFSVFLPAPAEAIQQISVATGEVA